MPLASHRLACIDKRCRRLSTEMIHLVSEGYSDIVRQLTVLPDKTSLFGTQSDHSMPPILMDGV